MLRISRLKTPRLVARPTRLRLVVAGIGAFLLVASLLLRFYAAPRLIAAPKGFSGVLTLSDPHGSYFDERALKTRSNVALSFTSTVRGDVSAGSSSVAVWDNYSVLRDAKDHMIVSETYQRSAFDRRTAQLVNCCGAAVNDDTRVRQYGVAGLDWPIGGLKKQSYEVYDVATERTWPAVFSGTATVQGLPTYKYVQQVAPTMVQQIPGVPISMLGVPGPSYNITAQRWYHATNTYWIDPRTGVPVNVEEKINSTLTDPAGDASLPVANADLKMSQSAQILLANLSKSSAAQINDLETAGPMLGVIIAVVLLLAAVIPYRRRSVPRRPGTSKA